MLRKLALLSPLVLGVIPFSLAMGGCAPAAQDHEDAESSTSELGARAADATGRGPSATTNAEYKFTASVDQTVLSDRMTEVWARMWRPTTLGNEKHPLIVLLHGNHGTCGTGTSPRSDDSVQYTMNGTCPSGYVVTPNHMGYAYLADRLASWGYIVVSINANRGITAGSGDSADWGLNIARGRLVLRHLQKLSEWDAQANTTPASLGVDLHDAIDFSNVGMMGHSRGGEGVRAAYTLYGDTGSPWPARIKSPVNVKAIFEIGPVDGQTNRTFNALGTAWNVLLPLCDGDVLDLQGMKPFDRMMALTSTTNELHPTPKGIFGVWGANHNFYNTEWQENDSDGCSGVGNSALWSQFDWNSTKQQTTALHALMGFFRAYVGASATPSFGQAYDPKFGVPQTLDTITHVERAYADAVSSDNVRVLEDFTKPTGTSLGGFATTASTGVTVSHGGVSEHDPMLKAAKITWTGGGATSSSSFQIPWSSSGSGVDASQMQTLDLRVSRVNGTAGGTAPITSFGIQLIKSDGTTTSTLKLKDYLEVAPSAGHVLLGTARIPIADFAAPITLNKVRGVRFVFNDTVSGAIYLTGIRFSRALVPPSSPPIIPGQLDPIGDPDQAPDHTLNIVTGNQLVGLRTQPNNAVEVEVSSQARFPVTNSLTRLRLNGHDVMAARYVDDGDTHRMVFTMSQDEFDATPDGAPMTVRYGDEHASRQYHFGAFRKTSVSP